MILSWVFFCCILSICKNWLRVCLCVGMCINLHLHSHLRRLLHLCFHTGGRHTRSFCRGCGCPQVGGRYTVHKGTDLQKKYRLSSWSKLSGMSLICLHFHTDAADVWNGWFLYTDWSAWQNVSRHSGKSLCKSLTRMDTHTPTHVHTLREAVILFESVCQCH